MADTAKIKCQRAVAREEVLHGAGCGPRSSFCASELGCTPATYHISLVFCSSRQLSRVRFPAPDSCCLLPSFVSLVQSASLAVQIQCRILQAGR